MIVPNAVLYCQSVYGDIRIIKFLWYIIWQEFLKQET
jgi:hypothetical protein